MMFVVHLLLLLANTSYSQDLNHYVRERPVQFMEWQTDPVLSTSIDSVPNCFLSRDCYLLGKGTWNYGWYKIAQKEKAVLFISGIKNPTSTQSLSLACVGPDGKCSRLQFIYFPNQKDAYYLGYSFQIRGDEKMITQKLNKLFTLYRNCFLNEESSEPNIKVWMGARKLSHSFESKSGWNWAENFLPISDDLFGKFVRLLQFDFWFFSNDILGNEILPKACPILPSSEY